jgi:hypothetical protein
MTASLIEIPSFEAGYLTGTLYFPAPQSRRYHRVVTPTMAGWQYPDKALSLACMDL